MAVLAFLQLSLVAVLTWARKGIAASSVGCYICQSFNHSDTGCEDPFHPAFSQYDPECRQGMPGRVGLFLAPFCIKMEGVHLATGDTIMVRRCSLNNMGYQCGIFEFEEKIYRGCLTTCHEDACNGTPPMGLITKYSRERWWTDFNATWWVVAILNSWLVPQLYTRRRLCFQVAQQVVVAVT